MKTVSESALKSRMTEYLREIEATGEELLVTHDGQAVLKIISYHREVSDNETSTEEKSTIR